MAVGLLERPVMAGGTELVPDSVEGLNAFGWGAFDDRGIHGCRPHAVLLHQVAWKQCTRSMAPAFLPPDDSWAVCAASVGENTCTGDSGGPVFLRGIQVAVTSTGDGCGDGAVGAYLRIDRLRTVLEDLGVRLTDASRER